MNNEIRSSMPQWDDQLWDVLHAMLYRSVIAWVPLIAILFNPNHSPMMETVRAVCHILSFGVAWMIIRSQQSILKQLKDKHQNSNKPPESSR